MFTIISFLSSLIIFFLYLKLIIKKLYNSYNVDVFNLAIALYSGILSVGYIVLFQTIINPLKDSFYILSKQGNSGIDLLKTFIPIIGQFLILFVLSYFILTRLSKYFTKVVFGSSIIDGVSNDQISVIVIFGAIYLPLVVIGYFFMNEIAQMIIPISSSIF